MSNESISFLRPRYAVALACVCAVAGLFTIYGSVQALLSIWSTDGLKSMGLLVPFISFALILRAWRSIGWATEGSWWGFVVLAGSSLLMFLRDQTLLIVTVKKDWLLQLPPLPLVAVVYALGMVLLFGGTRLLRAAWFPVLFMWAVIPVPQTFSRAIDLPLQHASAAVARSFAHAMGLQLTQENLRLIFTPQTAIFIAPGCDGIRGAITLGMAAIVVGYIYRFRWFIYFPVVIGAVMLGYLFNFLRLCGLMVYYGAVLHLGAKNHGEMADYIIGGCLFMVALTIFFTVVNKLRQDPNDVTPEPVPEAVQVARTRPMLTRVAAALLLSLVFGYDALRTHYAEAKVLGAAPAAVPMPAQIGSWMLVRTWNDKLIGGTLVYSWGEYAADLGKGPHIAMGISPVLAVHDAEVCHIARAEDPTWHGQIEAPSPSGSIDLTAATYNSGIAQKLEASTVCDSGSCRQFSQTSQHITLVYARPHKNLPMPDQTRPVPVLLIASTSDSTSPVSTVEPQLAAELADFLKNADLVKLTAPYGHR